MVLCLVALSSQHVKILANVATMFALMFCFVWVAHTLAAPELLASGTDDLNM
jgi:hypothetical protein